MILRVFALALAAAVASAWVSAAVAAEGDSETLPKGVAARVVGLAPNQGTITIRELRRTMAQMIAAAKLEGSRGQLPSGRALARKALAERLDFADVQGEARELGLYVTPQQVSTELQAIKKQNFDSKRAYWVFVHRAKFTRHDVRERVEVQILGTQIQELVVRGIHGKAAAARALKEFLQAYREHWRSRTVCAPAYLLGRCSNG